MNNGLSALKFIKNNRRRTSVLVISIGLFIMMLYSINYLLGGCCEPFKRVLVEQTEKVQVISCEDEATDEELNALVEKLNKLDNVEYAFASDRMSTSIKATIGEWGFSVPYTTKENIQKYLDYNNFKITKGRIPENPFELIFSEKLMKNAGYKVGDIVGSANFKIVGVYDSDEYFCLGFADGDNNNGKCITILSDGKGVDYQKVVKDLGYAKSVYIRDNVSGKKDLQKDVLNDIAGSKTLITLTCAVVLCICLLVVICMYIKDRYQEWCLYRSIGFTTKEIFLLANRELLITFIISIALGLVASLLSVGVMYLLLIGPKGLVSTSFMPDVIGECIVFVLLIYALCQIPISMALNKIKTIDAIEDDEF